GDPHGNADHVAGGAVSGHHFFHTHHAFHPPDAIVCRGERNYTTTFLLSLQPFLQKKRFFLGEKVKKPLTNRMQRDIME
ncbi:MAG: hypothetical protein J6W31_03735, partial [Clostridia bacterium]|nr:hypothetical protein [Clostridia bacterium]